MCKGSDSYRQAGDWCTVTETMFGSNFYKLTQNVRITSAPGEKILSVVSH